VISEGDLIQTPPFRILSTTVTTSPLLLLLLLLLLLDCIFILVLSRASGATQAVG
jgi:hypothetical protein